ncbi:hypothetical protein L3Y34_004223 [Caenorhabditis briggsae]|uniref:Uncharacterized protein n=1 Tax=Caenorhabditis briggsae TaxID=6238 RepID=A0AAE9A9Q6_CAEBR|nr:hypothetical protein L3Y34_004223 [Caenorhabditis briggsae]
MNENLDGVLNALLHNEREAARTFKVGDEAKRLRREDIVKKRRNTTWINLGKMVCSLTLEEFGLVPKSSIQPKIDVSEISKELTGDEVVSNVLGFVNTLKDAMGHYTRGTFVKDAFALTGALCGVESNKVISSDRRAKRMRKRKHELISKKEIRQQRDYDSEESSTDETIVKNMIEDHFFQITKKGKDEKQKEDSIEEDRTNKDTVKWYPKKKRNRTKVNPQKKLLKEIDVHEDPETKIARAIAEEAEKKKIRENEARKKKEQKWIELGQAVCSLSADDFILPSDVAENPDHKPDRSQRGEPIVVAVASFIQSMKALVGNKAAHDTVLADQSGIAAALCGIHKSALTARFSFKKSKFD